jgi:hypothetical protein
MAAGPTILVETGLNSVKAWSRKAACYFAATSKYITLGKSQGQS